MAKTVEFKYAPMFQVGEDKTEYRLLTKEGVSTATFEGKEIVKVSKEALTLLAQQAFHDVEFMLRREHNEQRAWNPSQQAVISLFNEYFGGGMNGIVFQEMREARGLAYSAYAAYQRPSRVGQTERYFTHIITQNDKMMDCIRQFNQILDEMPVSENAFNIAKDGLNKQLASLRVTKMSIISLYLMMKRLGLDTDLNKTVYEALPNVTLDQMAAFEREQMAGKKYRYIILGDEKELDMESLGKIGPIKRLTTEEIFGY